MVNLDRKFSGVIARINMVMLNMPNERTKEGGVMECENYILSTGAYFLQGKKVHKKCTREAKWIVTVNPPKEDKDGKVRLCDHCNKWDYKIFPRKKLDG